MFADEYGLLMKRYYFNMIVGICTTGMAFYQATFFVQVTWNGNFLSHLTSVPKKTVYMYVQLIIEVNLKRIKYMLWLESLSNYCIAFDIGTFKERFSRFFLSAMN